MVRCYVRGVDAVILTQVISAAVAVLAIVWHQQRSTERLRAEMRAEFAAVRAEIAAVRAEIGEVRVDVRDGRERLARIEGYLGIGIPAEAAATAAGAGVASGNPQA